MKPWWLLTCVTAIGMAGVTDYATAQTTYKDVKDFAIKKNPGPVWSYLDPNGILPTSTKSANGVSKWWEWADYNGSCLSAVVDRNKTGSTINYYTVSQPTSVLRLDPENQSFVEVRFTAPVSGKFLVSGSFTGIDSQERSHPVAINHNGGNIYSGIISAFGQYASFRMKIELAANDTIDFQNQTSSTGCSFLSTGLSVAVIGPN